MATFELNRGGLILFGTLSGSSGTKKRRVRAQTLREVELQEAP
jgi:hypothetical protein